LAGGLEPLETTSDVGGLKRTKPVAAERRDKVDPDQVLVAIERRVPDSIPGNVMEPVGEISLDGVGA
jgi:hypothetical protein